MSSIFFRFRIALLIHLSWAWTTLVAPSSCISSRIHQSQSQSLSSKTQLHSGVGIAKDYSWSEEAFEIEVVVKVPPETKAKDIQFKAKTNSIELTMVRRKTSGNGDDDETPEQVILLDPERPLRGRIDIDGTYWVISDAMEDEAKNTAATAMNTHDDDDENADDGDSEKLASPSNEPPGRQVTVTIEKQIKKAKDDFDVVDYDWNGVYREEEEGEVSYRKYDEPEVMDVREYAQSLGVDVDNINMSMVDKSMFSSGLNNKTKSGMDGLVDAGLMKEVTRQGDGSEWTTDKDGEKVPFNSMLKDKELDDNDKKDSNLQNLYGAAKDAEEKGVGQKNGAIPFLDIDSPWHNAAAAADTANEEAPKDAKKNKAWEAKKKQLEKKREKEAIDPIATLTVAKLREILRSRGLKVSGNKKELQDRLRAEVQSMVEMDTTE